jgi:hypothetical protein
MTDLTGVSSADLAAELQKRAAKEAWDAAQVTAARYATGRSLFEGATFTLPDLAAALNTAAATWPAARVAVTAQVVGRQIDALIAAWNADVAPQLALAATPDPSAEPSEES